MSAHSVPIYCAKLVRDEMSRAETWLHWRESRKLVLGRTLAEVEPDGSARCSYCRERVAVAW